MTTMAFAKRIERDEDRVRFEGTLKKLTKAKPATKGK